MSIMYEHGWIFFYVGCLVIRIQPSDCSISASHDFKITQVNEKCIESPYLLLKEINR